MEQSCVQASIVAFAEESTYVCKWELKWLTDRQRTVQTTGIESLSIKELC